MVTVRKGEKSDLPEVLKLIRELALFEKAPEEVTNTVADMEVDGFGPNPSYRLIVAELENKIVGMAIYFIKYSTWKGKGVYLDDIVVNENHRGKGIGKLIFDAVVNDCKLINAKQLHWQVLDWNEPAINFYRKLNASLDNEWINCKLTEDQIKNY